MTLPLPKQRMRSRKTRRLVRSLHVQILKGKNDCLTIFTALFDTIFALPVQKT